MRVFLIGGTGYIGKEVTRRALAAGHQVRVLSRSPKSDQKLDPASLAAVEVIRGSVEDVDLIGSEAGFADAVVYLAVQGFAGG